MKTIVSILLLVYLLGAIVFLTGCSGVKKLSKNIKSTTDKTEHVIKSISTDSTLITKSKTLETDVATITILYDSTESNDTFQLEIYPAKSSDYESGFKVKTNVKPKSIQVAKSNTKAEEKQTESSVKNRQEEVKNTTEKTVKSVKEISKVKFVFQWWWLLIFLIVSVAIYLGIRYKSFIISKFSFMKKLFFFGLIASLFLTSCTKSFTSDNTAKFIQLDNAGKWYPAFDAAGNPIMEADSIYKQINGAPVKVGINQRQKKIMGKDSVVDIGPGAAIVKKYINEDPWKELRLIFGIICLIAVPVIYYFYRNKPVAKYGSLIPAAIAIFLFYTGMTAIQKRVFDASKNNTKHISTEAYRYYFTNDKDGSAFLG